MTKEISTRLLKPRNNYFVMGCSPTLKKYIDSLMETGAAGRKKISPA
jgi:hypothetical protein